MGSRGPVEFQGRYDLFSGQGFKPPVWSAGEAMVAAGHITPREFERWQETFRRIDADYAPVTYFLPIFCAIGRRRS